MRQLSYKKYRSAILIDMNELINDAYHASCCVAYNYQLDLSPKNKDIVKLLYNEIILRVCSEINNVANEKIIFYFFSEKVVDLFSREINKIITKLPKLIPINIHHGIISYTQLNEFNIVDTDLDILIDKISNKDNCQFSLRKLKKFLKDNDLVFLHDSYFNKIQIKLALLR